MAEEQDRYRSYKEIAEELKAKYGLEIGSYVLIPAMNGRKQKKKVDYGEMIDLVGMQSGKYMIMFRQGNKKLLFTMEELQKCWSKVEMFSKPKCSKV